MKHISLIEALTDCTTTCGWCLNECPDEDKYETLVNCIRFQKECLTLFKTVYSILAGGASECIGKINNLLEALAENVQKDSGITNTHTSKSMHSPQQGMKKPGCSHIFQIAQLLEQSYFNKF